MTESMHLTESANAPGSQSLNSRGARARAVGGVSQHSSVFAPVRDGGVLFFRPWCDMTARPSPERA